MLNFKRSIQKWKVKKIYEKINYRWLPWDLNKIGLVYDSQGDYKKSIEYYNRCIEVAKESKVGNVSGYITDCIDRSDKGKGRHNHLVSRSNA